MIFRSYVSLPEGNHIFGIFVTSSPEKVAPFVGSAWHQGGAFRATEASCQETEPGLEEQTWATVAMPSKKTWKFMDGK